MPTVDLFPSGAGSEEDWSPGGGGNHALVADDDDGTVVTTGLEQQTDLHAMDNMPAGAVVVASVTMHFRASGDGVGPRLGGEVKLGASSEFPTTMGITASLDDYSGSVDRPAGGSWSVADVNAVEAGYASVTLTAGNMTTARFFLRVDYTAGRTQTLTSYVSRTSKLDAKASRTSPANIDAKRTTKMTANASRTVPLDVFASRTIKFDVKLRKET